MKKIIYPILAILCFSACGNQASDNTKGSGSSTELMATQVDLVTLNGYTFKQADTMVNTFLRESHSAEKQTSIWFSKTYIDSLDAILPGEGADGIRIYFAREGEKNALIIVSTRQSKAATKTSFANHKDYFEHKSKFFQPGNNTHITGTIENGVPEARLHAGIDKDCSNLPCNSLGNTIPCKQGHKWVNQFRQDTVTTKSIWYPIELVHSWKKELDRAVANGLKGDGIRIYFAKNDKNKSMLVFTTTRENKMKRTDFYDCSSNITQKDGDGNNGFVADNGEECPNNCNDVTWP